MVNFLIFYKSLFVFMISCDQIYSNLQLGLHQWKITFAHMLSNTKQFSAINYYLLICSQVSAYTSVRVAVLNVSWSH